MATTTLSPTSRAIVIALDRSILALARHWLALANAALFVFATLPLVAPFLLAAGWTGAANWIYSAYSYVCHQMPSRSFFLFGEQIAFCQRNTAIYLSLALGGLLFAPLRHRLRPLPFRLYLLFILPMAVDGFTQLFGLRLSTPLLRVWTGSLFGLATLWLALPYLELTFGEMRAQLEEKLGRLAD